MLSSGSAAANCAGMRLHYLPTLRSTLLAPLITHGNEDVQEVGTGGYNASAPARCVTATSRHAWAIHHRFRVEAVGSGTSGLARGHPTGEELHKTPAAANVLGLKLASRAT